MALNNINNQGDMEALARLINELSAEQQYQLSLTNHYFKDLVPTMPHTKIYNVSVDGNYQQDFFFSRRYGVHTLQFDMDSNHINYRFFHQRLQMFDRVSTLHLNFTEGFTRNIASNLLLNIPIGYGPRRNITIHVKEDAYHEFDEAYRTIILVRDDLFLPVPTGVERRPIEGDELVLVNALEEEFAEIRTKERELRERQIRERLPAKKPVVEKKVVERKPVVQRVLLPRAAKKKQTDKTKAEKRQPPKKQGATATTKKAAAKKK